MTDDPELLCWEALDPSDPSMETARELYESTQAPDEQIPWEWITGGVANRPSWRPGRWSTHLLLAAPRPRSTTRKAIGKPIGFACGLHAPGLGGYLTYIGVDPTKRGKGIGGRLMFLLRAVLRVDAACSGDELSFIIWESRPPKADDEVGRAIWRSRLRLFERVGAFWVGGVTFRAINYNNRRAPAIPLQLFLWPVGKPAECLDAEELIEVVASLGREVYKLDRDHELMQQSLPKGCRPWLRPVAEASDLTRARA
jgi:hypothetical protein